MHNYITRHFDEINEVIRKKQVQEGLRSAFDIEETKDEEPKVNNQKANIMPTTDGDSQPTVLQDQTVPHQWSPDVSVEQVLMTQREDTVAIDVQPETSNSPLIKGNLGHLLIDIAYHHKQKKRLLKEARKTHQKLMEAVDQVKIYVGKFELPNSDESDD